MDIDEQALRARYELIAPFLNERLVRLWAGNEARALGHGGTAVVVRATGISAPTVRRGMREVVAGEGDGRIRAKGGGRKRLTATDTTLLRDLEALVEPLTRGDPESPLRWTCKSGAQLAAALNAGGYRVSARKVTELLAELDYSLQAPAKVQEGTQHPDRDAQFTHINAQATAFLAAGQPVVSVDTKKKELVGAFKNAGQEWQPAGEPTRALVHDFPDDAVGKAIPYGVYDVGRNAAWVSVGCDHDTPAFAGQALRAWWQTMGHAAYPTATRLLITADSGGSNSRRSRVWKATLQDFADAAGLEITVCHFPPGTSKWNKIEHRLFSHITLNWRGRPLIDFETVVSCIGATTTRTGLKVRAGLDTRRYPLGQTISKAEMDQLQIERNAFHGDWNYTLKPRSKR